MATMILRETHKALIEELESLEKLKRETSEKIKEAAGHGDLKENAEYHAAREKQSLILYKKQLMQSHAPFQIVESKDIKTSEVVFGTKVTIREEGSDQDEIYYILGPIEFELDLYPEIATYHSPFGQNILGKKVNEQFSIKGPEKEIKFTVTSIEKIS
tara:strand:+ start:556 stop:1029 length:474 start_codon:yes stop_codon:yes gene_type:complete